MLWNLDYTDLQMTLGLIIIIFDVEDIHELNFFD